MVQKILNNNIQEDYCSFEVSKLLKEKGLFLNNYFIFRVTKDSGKYPWQKEGSLLNEHEHLDETCSPNHGVPGINLIQCPTHALAIKWIRENFGIHIYPTQVFAHNESREDYLQSKGFTPWITVTKNNILQEKETPPCMVIKYNSPEEAVEAALLYTLNNLI